MVPQKQQQLNILLGLQDHNKVFLKHYNGSNDFLLVNITKLYHFKAKYSEIKPYPLRFGNIAKDFAVNNMNKTELNVHVYDFSVKYNIFDISELVILSKPTNI